MATRTKHYEAELKDLDHLLQVIESEMGPDAQLETMEYTKGGIMGLGGRKMISITATVEVNPQRIGSGLRRTIKLEDTWNKSGGEDTQPAVAAAAKAEEDDSRLVDLSKGRRTPRGGGFGEGATDVPPPPRPRVETPAAAPVEEPAAAPEPEVAAPPVDATPSPQEAAASIIADVPVIAQADEVVYTAPEPAPAIEVEPQFAAGFEHLQTTTEEWTASETPAAEPIREPAAVREERPAVAAQAEAPAATDHDDELAASVAEIRMAMQRIGAPELGPATGSAEIDIAAAMGSAFAVLRRDVFNRLVDWNIRSTDALALIERASKHYRADAEPSEEGLFNLTVTEMLRGVRTQPGLRIPRGKRHVIALVGATGAGKTSLAAKLAARYAFEHDLRVGLISMDTYRIAAVDQLRTFGEIMGFGVEVAYTAEEFAKLAESLDADLIIVDTAGRSPLNLRQLDELQNGFAWRWPDEVLLALPATLRQDDLALTLEAFAPLQPTSTVVTKLDETRSLGMLHNLTQLDGPPVAFYSTGQSIPEDLYEAQPGFLIGWADSLGYSA
jgi:flagellar biosynthesis protein FlhF